MSTRLILGFLSGIITLALSVASCSAVSSIKSSLSSSSIPSSNYPVDIIGRVTIANDIIANGTEAPYLHGQDFWIVQVSIRNKSYPNTITPTSSWGFSLESSPSNSAVYVDPNVTQLSSASITQGKSGELTLCCYASIAADPSQYQIVLLSGETAISYGSLVNTNTIAEVYNWDLQKVTQISTSPIIETPSGTYTATIIGIKQTLTFKSKNTLEMYDPVDGETLYTYSISSDGQTLTATNIATNEVTTNSFKYIPSQGLVVLVGISYFK